MRLVDAEAIIEVMKKCAENPENAKALLCYRYTQRILEEAPTVEPSPPWHRVEEPPKEEGKYFVAYRSSVVDGWGYDTAYYTKHLEYKMLMIPVPENSEGWFNWSDYNDCDVLVCPDYWMPIEPPKEDA